MVISEIPAVKRNSERKGHYYIKYEEKSLKEINDTFYLCIHNLCSQI